MRKAIVLILIFVFAFGVIGCAARTETGPVETDSIETDPVETETDISDPLKGELDEEVDSMETPYGKLIWSDEFDQDGVPDPKKWSYDMGGHGWGNQELQHYTNRPENARVEEGVLIIEALKEEFLSAQYTSARLVTKNKGDWMYGRVEVSAKLPQGRGTWPAIWMLPTDSPYGYWPSGGEIDIMEHVGFQPGSVHANIHTGKYNHSIGTGKGKTTRVDTYDTEFHVYAVEWRPYVLDFFIDDTLYFTYVYDWEKDGEDGYMAWPFDKDFHLVLNIAVGGAWGGQRGVDDSIFPQKMEIEYVRVYDLGYNLEKSDKLPPDAPVITSLQKTDTGYELRWKAPKDDYGILLYRVYMDGKAVAYPFKNHASLRNVESGGVYEFQVEAMDHAKNTTMSESVTFTAE